MKAIPICPACGHDGFTIAATKSGMAEIDAGVQSCFTFDDWHAPAGYEPHARATCTKCDSDKHTAHEWLRAGVERARKNECSRCDASGVVLNDDGVCEQCVELEEL